jgi:hypothetical protein
LSDSAPNPEIAMATIDTNPQPGLVKEVICPNCWERFPPERIWYVATDAALYGDLRLGAQERRRFLPTSFHPDGRALDAKGSPCHELACPKCHLSVPRVFVERPSFFVSIFGSPSSGKSYVLTTMTHRLRRVLPSAFAIDYSDADPQANAILHSYEDTLFAAKSPTDLVQLLKTGEVGDWYQKVVYGTKEILYPKPFFFQISPVGGHPLERNPGSVARTLCIYDNAGESFQPGADRPDNPVTQHMAKSGCMMFVFDPTQEAEFRKQLQGLSQDEQVQGGVMYRQDVLLAEAARRVKTYRGLPAGAQHDRPLIVLVSKYDAWHRLVGEARLGDPWVKHGSGRFSVLRVDAIRKVSAIIREMLRKHTPSIVSTAESFVDPRLVLYLPVSASGGPPVPGSGGKFRAGDISPMWAEVPMLYALSQFGSSGAVGGGLIPFFNGPVNKPQSAAGVAEPVAEGKA